MPVDCLTKTYGDVSNPIVSYSAIFFGDEHLFTTFYHLFWCFWLISSTGGSTDFWGYQLQILRYLQSTADQMPKLLTGHGARVAEKLEEILEIKNEILALTPQLGKAIGKPWG